MELNINKMNNLYEHLNDLDVSIRELEKSYGNYIKFFRIYNLQDYSTAAIDSLWQQAEDLNNKLILETFKLKATLSITE